MSFLDNEQIVQTVLEDEMRSSYLDYSMSVIVSRALPDVRDGLKPVHRRILFAMQELGLMPNRAYKKSARLVGEVLGKYHPHGDSSVYDAMVRMAQDWAMRYPLVDGQGNYGSVDGDPPAAMRYTETRLAQIALYLLRDLDKNTVDFQSNFDDTLEEPKVLPTVMPNLLVNGTSGIAVGMATNIPPHNLNEIVTAIQAVISNPDITPEELLEYVPGPDFPTGGIIYGYQGIKEAYLTGRGRIIVRAKAEVEVNKQGKQTIIVNELPYQVNKASLIEKIAELVRKKVLEDISDLRDESDRDGMRIIIELKRDAIAQIVLNNLYKHTQLQVTFGANMLALVGGRPVTLSLKDMMVHFIAHRNEVIVRRTQYLLDEAQKRAHILEGLLIALDNIDAVIKLIKKESPDPKAASIGLQTNFNLSEIQAKAILEMRLQRLTGLERDKIQAEYLELIKTIEKLQSILASKELQMQIVSDELKELSEKYNDKRRTEITFDSSEFSMEELIPNEDVIITITHNGLIKRTPVSSYRRQNKGGRGVKGAGGNDDDFIEIVFQSSNHAHLLFFTDKGRAYKVKVYDLPEGGRTAKGRSLANVIQKTPDEKVTAFLPVKDFDADSYIMMCTKRGTVKKVDLSAFANVRVNGIIAINLNDNDSLISTRITDGSCQVLIATRNGIACRFNEQDVRSMGRTAAGVRGITLVDDDYVVAMAAFKDSKSQVLIVAEKGYGKRTQIEQFRLTKRGAKGVISMNITPRTGPVVNMMDAVDTDDLVVITSKGILIRQQISDIRVIGRNTQGVRLIRLDQGDSIADITTVSHVELDDEFEDSNGVDDKESLFTS